MDNPKNISIIGAGLMGHGIAYVLARAGHLVSVFDRSPESLASLEERLDALATLFGHDRSAVIRVSSHNNMAEAVSNAEVVIEAAIENLEIKQFIVAELESIVSSDTIIASNTSALPITEIASKASNPERIVGSHFWNPPHLVKLVEIIQAQKTSDATVEYMMALLTDAGHHAVHVRKDVPGFIGNRLQHALKREAIAIVAAGICDAKTVDDVVKYGFGKRLAVMGPLEQSDLVGLKLTHQIHETLMPDIDRTNKPHPYLEDRIAKGHLGMSTGEGFRKWTPEEAKALRDKFNSFLLEQAKE
ncbi:3-hydroxyacyl-CoA dehydrogenase [Marinomonas ushuaiensis DSM 15871]|uniref:3-hydroxyacyl-CoA dehydrogenase n=1 Tax=Marinomonas ushuaiensis DSM 15871 TaxID=1122207 RepID=X7EA81_9GAMM|nr:3-hydroxyacyl-CoA dehydrogenase NAD-binding domain-containing protein [Marinomonas ushuaiensis]ETX12121.1 3-hydroxyacyl-CoA dehydrogenase [Marinomonas ushuaiensis DSM 15871]